MRGNFAERPINKVYRFNRSSDHDIVCVVLERDGVLAGMSAFLGEGIVEFFLERLPVGGRCKHQLVAGVGGHVMAAISLWTKNRI